MSGYCKYCDTIIKDEDVVRAFDDNNRLIWSGCLPCYNKRIELMKHVKSK